MKKLVLCISTLAILAIACQKLENNVPLNGDEMAPAVKMITETISGSRGADTKATISNGTPAAFAWTENTDKVAVHVKGTTPQYVTSGGASASAATASFTVEYETGYERDAFAVYPSTIVAADAANYGQSEHTLDVTLPSAYTLAEVQGEVSPCPMIATNATGAGWDFYQLCGLLRLTVNGIPTTAKRLEIDFNGKQVWGNFSIASPVIPNTSNIDTADDATKDCITVTKDGTDAKLGETSLIINIPLPAGTYNKISVIAYDEISGGNALYAGFVPFARTVDHTKAIKKATTLGPLQGTFTFTFKDEDTENELGGLRFVRLFSCQNKLYNGETTFGPYTDSRATGAGDMDKPIEATLKFAPDADDQLAFQVIDASGKVYSGLYDVFTKGYSSNMTVDVKAYTFTVASGKKVYFSPGDLGIASNVYSFTKPFDNWGWSDASASTRVWFNYNESANFGTEQSVYGLNWRFPKCLTDVYNNSSPNEWDNIIGRSIDGGKVAAYYHIKVGSNNCLLLPPDETVERDLEGLTNGATDTNYVKYLGKGFVLLMNTGRAYSFKAKWNWGLATQGFYWGWHVRMDHSRRYFNWTDSNDNEPALQAYSQTLLMRVRYVRDVE